MIAEQLHQVKQQIQMLCERYQRPAESVQLLAVSKTQAFEKVLQAIEQGQFAFGENYLQEAVEKIQQIRAILQRENPQLVDKIEWHFIGALQSNKTRPVAEHFDWLHSLETLKQAERLNAQRPATLVPLNVCIQMNSSGEQQKSGISLADFEQLKQLAQQVAQLPRLKLRGLMTVPAPETDLSQQRIPFQHLKKLFEQLNQTGFALDTLSMGMSGDMEAAIAEGATIVRIGTAIFGQRY